MARIYPLNTTDRDTLIGLRKHWQDQQEDDLAAHCTAALAGSLEDMRWILHELSLRPVPRNVTDAALASLAAIASPATPGGAPGDAPEECEDNDCTGCPWCDAHGITSPLPR